MVWGEPRARKRLVELSAADRWEEACREWEFDDLIIEETDERFTGECDLCHEQNLVRQFEIRNTRTGLRLLVGSNCVKRFVVLYGAETLEDSWTMFRQRVRRLGEKERARRGADAILDGTASPEDVLAFAEYAKKELDAKNRRLGWSPEEWRAFLKSFFGVEDVPAEVSLRLLEAVRNPRSLKLRSSFRNPSQKEMEALMRFRRSAGRASLKGMGRGAHTRPADRSQ